MTKLIVAFRNLAEALKKIPRLKLYYNLGVVTVPDLLISALEFRIDSPVRVCRVVVEVWIHACDICLHVSHATYVRPLVS